MGRLLTAALLSAICRAGYLSRQPLAYGNPFPLVKGLLLSHLAPRQSWIGFKPQKRGQTAYFWGDIWGDIEGV